MRIIDAHIHLPRQGTTVEDLLKAADRNSIEKLCFSLSLKEGMLLSEPPLEVCVKVNREVKDAMDRYPKRIAGLCYINPALGEAGLEEFERCIKEFKMRGLKLLAARRCNDPSVDPFIEAAIEFGVPILQHAWLKSTGNDPHESTPQDVAEKALKYTDATIIMAHIAGNWEIGAQAIRDCRNVMVDTSGTICDAGMIEYTVKLLGAERIIYGSDNLDFTGQVAKILAAEITDEEKNMILANNIERVMEP